MAKRILALTDRKSIASGPTPSSPVLATDFLTLAKAGFLEKTHTPFFQSGSHSTWPSHPVSAPTELLPSFVYCQRTVCGPDGKTNVRCSQSIFPAILALPSPLTRNERKSHPSSDDTFHQKRKTPGPSTVVSSQDRWLCVIDPLFATRPSPKNSAS